MRDTQRGRDIGRGRSRLPVGSLMCNLIPGPGTHPEPKADAQSLSTQAPQVTCVSEEQDSTWSGLQP